MCAGFGRQRSQPSLGDMPGVTKYNLVDDAHDLRIPMHNDEVFKHGVCFEAKVRTAVRNTRWVSLCVTLIPFLGLLY